MGFEPTISGLKVRRPGPLDDGASRGVIRMKICLYDTAKIRIVQEILA